MEIEHFINQGYGWLCKHCLSETETRASQSVGRARFFTEGEAEDKEPRLSSTALARWRDATRTTLFCPRCEVEEMVNKA
ncbi:MAG: hypothetical protein JOZ52_03500 [Acidobacteria bacterium]|nr:hypothetical protein [Acidobacteriota bacterium]